jgi:phospholipase D1/2
MAMMYEIIAKELERAGLSDQYHPQDYLNFYCLGKRENSPYNSSEINQQHENSALV